MHKREGKREGICFCLLDFVSIRHGATEWTDWLGLSGLSCFLTKHLHITFGADGMSMHAWKERSAKGYQKKNSTPLGFGALMRGLVFIREFS